MNDAQEGHLQALQARLEEAAAEVKATMMATRNMNKFKIPDEIRKMATETAKSRILSRRESFGKHGKTEGNVMPEWEPFPEVRLCRDQS